MASYLRQRGQRRLPRLIALAVGALLAVAPLAASTAAHAAPATGTLTASATSIPNGTTITFIASKLDAIASNPEL